MPPKLPKSNKTRVSRLNLDIRLPLRGLDFFHRFVSVQLTGHRFGKPSGGGGRLFVARARQRIAGIAFGRSRLRFYRIDVGG